MARNLARTHATSTARRDGVDFGIPGRTGLSGGETVMLDLTLTQDFAGGNEHKLKHRVHVKSSLWQPLPASFFPSSRRSQIMAAGTGLMRRGVQTQRRLKDASRSFMTPCAESRPTTRVHHCEIGTSGHTNPEENVFRCSFGSSYRGHVL